MNYVLIPFEQSPLDKIWETTCRQKSWTSYLPRFLRFWVIINKSGPQLKQFLGRAGSVGQDAAVCLRLFKNDFFFSNVVWLCVVNGFKVVDLLLHVASNGGPFVSDLLLLVHRPFVELLRLFGRAQGKTPNTFMAFCQNGAVDMDTF